MLVLTRKRSEMIHIGDDVVVKVVKTGTKSVRIGIEAPDHVRIVRAELVEAPAGPRADGASFERRGEETLAFASSDQFPHAV